MDNTNNNANSHRSAAHQYGGGWSSSQLPIMSNRMAQSSNKSYFTSEVISRAQSQNYLQYTTQHPTQFVNYKHTHVHQKQYENGDNYQCNIEQQQAQQYSQHNGVKHPYGCRRVRLMSWLHQRNQASATQRSIANIKNNTSREVLKLKSSRRVLNKHQDRSSTRDEPMQGHIRQMLKQVEDAREPKTQKVKQDKGRYKERSNNYKQNRIINKQGSQHENRDRNINKPGAQNQKQSNSDNKYLHVKQHQNGKQATIKERVTESVGEVVDGKQYRTDRSNTIVANSGQTGSKNVRVIQTDNNNEDLRTLVQKNTQNNSKSQPAVNNNAPIVQQTLPIGMPVPQTIDMSKVISQMMIKNNEYLHKLNESVVNRLLTIIENKTQLQSMGNSRCTHFSHTQQDNLSRQHSCKQQHQQERSCSRSNNKYVYNTLNKNNGSSQVDVDTHTNIDVHSYNHTLHNSHKNSQHQHNQIAQQSLEQTHGRQQRHPHQIIINNIVPTSTKSQALPSLNNRTISSSSLQTQQLQLNKLQNKRRQRQRQFNYLASNGHQPAHDMQTPRNNFHPTIIDYSNSSNVHAHNLFGISHQPMLESASNSQISQSAMPKAKQSLNQYAIIHQSHQQDKPQHGMLTHQVNMKKNNNPTPDQDLTTKFNDKVQITNGQQSITNSHFMFDVERVQSQNSVQLPVTSNSKNKYLIKPASIQQHFCNSNMLQKPPVFMEIPLGDNDNEFKNMSLAQAFKKKIGKLPTRAERKAQQQQTLSNNKQNQTHAVWPQTKVANSATKLAKNRENKQNNKRNQSHSSLQVDVRGLNIKNQQNSLITPKSNQPSQELLNRLIGGSKAKVTRKQMYALTRKNYENLPQVQQKKRNQQKKQLEQQRIERIRQYQKSIRASKTTIASIN